MLAVNHPSPSFAMTSDHSVCKKYKLIAFTAVTTDMIPEVVKSVEMA